MTEIEKIEKRIKIGTRLRDRKDGHLIEISGEPDKTRLDTIIYPSHEPNGRNYNYHLDTREGRTRLKGDDIVHYGKDGEDEKMRRTILPDKEEKERANLSG